MAAFSVYVGHVWPLDRNGQRLPGCTVRNMQPAYSNTAMEISRLVSHYVATERFQVEHQTPWNATLVRGPRINHILHLILTLVTCGLWAPIWLLGWLWLRRTRLTIWADAAGEIHQEVTRLR